jgi:YHS domain-containing protein
MTKDPVCLMPLDEDKALATSTYKGKTYYFCSHMCKDRFDKAYDREGEFLKRWEQETGNQGGMRG